ncbi:CopG family transcriptional regulator [uncultured Brevundimonas sp.]|uniref:type II toxin-antitoxin system RelB family antitoxin n=1 Tax=uncultured Brevundimonas sp. TaxID=213418 RepID=UPI00261C1226|nr:CopG family transcriptional regulator [uncultured Brevundimonas sp.]
MTIDLPDDIDERLDRLATETGFSKASLLPDLFRLGIENLEDYYHAAAASERIRMGLDKVLSSAEVRASLGLDD